MAGRGADEGGRKPAGSGAHKGSVRARKLRPRGTEIAAVERREAPALRKRRGTRRIPAAPRGAPPLGVLPRDKKSRRPRAAKKTGAMTHAYPSPEGEG
jgi:hypothetical protein